MKATVELLNFTVNIFWTSVCCAPVLLFWISYYDPAILFPFLFLSSFFLFLPQSIFNRIQLSQRRRFYERLGVKRAQYFTQNGKFVNRLLRLTGASHKIVNGRSDLIRLKKQMMGYEKYHLMCLVFFLFTSVWALLLFQYVLATAVFIANIVYNVYPLLIQQYNRVRIRVGL